MSEREIKRVCDERYINKIERERSEIDRERENECMRVTLRTTPVTTVFSI